MAERKAEDVRLIGHIDIAMTRCFSYLLVCESSLSQAMSVHADIGPTFAEKLSSGIGIGITFMRGWICRFLENQPCTES